MQGCRVDYTSPLAVATCIKLGTLGKFPRGARLEYTALKGVQGPAPPLPFRGRKFLGHAKIKHFPIVSGSKLAAGLSFLPTPAWGPPR